MTTREKIIVGAMAVAVLYGGIHFALPSGRGDAARKGAADYSALVTRVQVGIQQGELSAREQHALAAASGEWLQDPFLARPLTAPGEAAASPRQAPLPRYTGYIDVGPRPIAVIDGRDYRQEETLKGGEFRIQRIFADRVELVRRGASEAVIVPLALEQQENTYD